jgi:hypothetical protein
MTRTARLIAAYTRLDRRITDAITEAEDRAACWEAAIYTVIGLIILTLI